VAAPGAPSTKRERAKTAAKCDYRALSGLLLRKQELDLRAKLPICAEIGPYHIKSGQRAGHSGQLAEVENATAQWQGSCWFEGASQIMVMIGVEVN
jgi:hypothetical protein